MSLHNRQESLSRSVWDCHHHPQSWSAADIHHSEHPDLLCSRSPTMVLYQENEDVIATIRVLKHYLITHFGLVSEKGLINLHRDSWASKHQWYISVKKTPAANVSEVLVHLHCTFLLHLSLLSCISHRVLAYPLVYQHNPLPQSQL